MASQYWVESLGQALDDLGIRLTDDQVVALAEECGTIAELESQYTGRDCIPNPLHTEIDRLKAKHKADLAAVERRGMSVERELIERSGGDPEYHFVRVDGATVEVTR